MNKRERQLKGFGIQMNDFLGMNLKDIDNDIRYCDNLREAKKTIQAYCPQDITFYKNDEYTCVKYKDTFVFSFSKNYYIYKIDFYSHKERVIDVLLNELRRARKYSYTSYKADKDKRISDFIYTIDTYWGNKKYVWDISIKGTKGILEYKDAKIEIKRLNRWMEDDIKSLQEQIEKTIKKLNDLVQEKNEYREKSVVAQSIKEQQEKINKLLGKEVA